MKRYRQLLPDQEKIIVQKGTEAAHTGEDHGSREGIYVCRMISKINRFFAFSPSTEV